MNIVEATTDEQILAARDVMRQLRTGISPADYLPTVRRMIGEGYRQAVLYDEAGVVRAVAGFRIFEMLYAGRLMYVDDLRTDEASRSLGHGRALLGWLKEEARARGCTQLHLDSGVQREQAHRFYFRERMTVNCFHFRMAL